MKGLALVATILSFRVTALCCTYFPQEFKVHSHFEVKVSDRGRPVSGLRVKLADSIGWAVEPVVQTGSADQRTPQSTVATTNNLGIAKFDVRQGGRFDLTSDHPAEANFLIVVQVVGQNETQDVRDSIELNWPAIPVLEISSLRGEILNGLYRKHFVPLPEAKLTLRKALTFEEIAEGKTDDQGRFEFAEVPSGLYFLQLEAQPAHSSKEADWEPRGEIAISINKLAPVQSFNVAVAYTSCGLQYDFESNKKKYKAFEIPD